MPSSMDYHARARWADARERRAPQPVLDLVALAPALGLFAILVRVIDDDDLRRVSGERTADARREQATTLDQPPASSRARVVAQCQPRFTREVAYLFAAVVREVGAVGSVDDRPARVPRQRLDDAVLNQRRLAELRRDAHARAHYLSANGALEELGHRREMLRRLVARREAVHVIDKRQSRARKLDDVLSETLRLHPKQPIQIRQSPRG